MESRSININSKMPRKMPSHSTVGSKSSRSTAMQSRSDNFFANSTPQTVSETNSPKDSFEAYSDRQPRQKPDGQYDVLAKTLGWRAQEYSPMTLNSDRFPSSDSEEDHPEILQKSDTPESSARPRNIRRKSSTKRPSTAQDGLALPVVSSSPFYAPIIGSSSASSSSTSSQRNTTRRAKSLSAGNLLDTPSLTSLSSSQQSQGVSLSNFPTPPKAIPPRAHGVMRSNSVASSSPPSAQKPTRRRFGSESLTRVVSVKTIPMSPMPYQEYGISVFDTIQDDKDRRYVIWGKSGDSSLDAVTMPKIITKTPGEPVLIAATVEKLVAHLTSTLDYDFLTDFFLTYRMFLTPVHLMKLLILRFKWALSSNAEARQIVRVRTFVTVRHWLLNYFEADFIPSRPLRHMLTEWLNEVNANEIVRSSVTDQRIIKGLKKVVRKLKKVYYRKGGPAYKPRLGGMDSSEFKGKGREVDTFATSTPMSDSLELTRPNTSSSKKSVRIQSEEGHDIERRNDGSRSNYARHARHVSESSTSVASTSMPAEVTDSDHSGIEERPEIALSSRYYSDSDIKKATMDSLMNRQFGIRTMRSTMSLGSINTTESIKSFSKKQTKPIYPKDFFERQQLGKKTLIWRRTATDHRLPIYPRSGRIARLKRHHTITGAFLKGHLLPKRNREGDIVRRQQNINSSPPMFAQTDEFAVVTSDSPIPMPSRFTPALHTPTTATTIGFPYRPVKLEDVQQLSQSTILTSAGQRVGSTVLSRYLTNTLGKLARVKRALGGNSYAYGGSSAAILAACTTDGTQQYLSSRGVMSLTNGAAFEGSGNIAEDIDWAENERGDLLFYKGGVDRYFHELERMETLNRNAKRMSMPTSEVEQLRDSRSARRVSVPNSIGSSIIQGLGINGLDGCLGGGVGLRNGIAEGMYDYSGDNSLQEEDGSHGNGSMEADLEALDRQFPRSWLENGSQEAELDVLKMFKHYRNSDSSTDPSTMPAGTKTLRRLPKAQNLKDMETLQNLAPARQSWNTVSSLGQVETSSARRMFPAFHNLDKDAPMPTTGESPLLNVDVDESPMLGDIDIPALLALEALSSDESDNDVEGALRRLEGKVDLDAKRQKREERKRNTMLFENGNALLSPLSPQQESSDPMSPYLTAGEDTPRASPRGDMEHYPYVAYGVAITSSKTMLPETNLHSGDDEQEIQQLQRRNSKGRTLRRRRQRIAVRDIDVEQILSGDEYKSDEGVLETTNMSPFEKPRKIVRQSKSVEKAKDRSRRTTPGNSRSFLGLAGFGSPSKRSPNTQSTPDAYTTPPTHMPGSPSPRITNQPFAHLPIHRSFVLLYKAEDIAQQFCLIERDLLASFGWQEIIEMEWLTKQEDVLDWEAYLKRQRKEALVRKAEGGSELVSGIEKVISRFNLTCNWVISEIVLTHSTEQRVAVVEKYLRIALKCFEKCNYATLMQIMLALQNPAVSRLQRTWARVGTFEMRIFKNLSEFTSPVKNWRNLRTAMSSVLEEWGGSIMAPSPLSDEPATMPTISSPTTAADLRTGAGGCIPFLGLYLRDLGNNAELPQFLDPTDPKHPPQFLPSQNEMVLGNPDAFVDRMPLMIPLSPLVNWSKLRTAAVIVKKILTFQSLAKRYSFAPERHVYMKCLKMRSLETDKIDKCSRLCES